MDQRILLGPQEREGLGDKVCQSGDHMTLGVGRASKLRELELELCPIQDGPAVNLQGLVEELKTQHPVQRVQTPTFGTC